MDDGEVLEAKSSSPFHLNIVIRKIILRGVATLHHHVRLNLRNNSHRKNKNKLTMKGSDTSLCLRANNSAYFRQI